jgi:hypothetical protein
MERAMEGTGAMGSQTPKEKMEVTERKMTSDGEGGVKLKTLGRHAGISLQIKT